MSFPRYPAYKDSGVEWLGEVPDHWEAWKLAHAFGSIGSGTTPPSNEEQWYDNVGIPWVTTGELRENIIMETKKSVTNAALDKFSALRVHPAGSLVVAMYGATIGRLGILGIDAVTNQACCVLSTPRHLDIAFTYYWLQGFKQIIIDLFSTGGGQPNINQDVVASLRIPAPGLAEQAAIANFLDHETAKIDALVAEQERLIELLKEKRQAVISHAVTKGLDPSVPMKDSGVEWLGEVPAHWGVTTIKRIVSTPVTDGPHETPVFLDEGIPFVSAEAVSSGRIDFERIRGFISLEDHRRFSQKYIPQRDDIFMIKSGATTGVSAIVETDVEFNIWSPLAVIRCGPDVLPRFALHFIRSRNFLEGVTLGWSFGTQQNIGMGVIENLSIVVPPLATQTEIVELLDKYAAQADELIGEAEKTITILQERRTALISAAVTGQIDVRNLASALPA
ncbi:MAG: restriction endonuclease subunit S [Rhodocyclaceae bacterium]